LIHYGATTTHIPVENRRKKEFWTRGHYSQIVVSTTYHCGLQTAKLFVFLILCGRDYSSSFILRVYRLLQGHHQFHHHFISYLTQKFIHSSHFGAIKESREGTYKGRLEVWKIIEEISIIAKHTSLVTSWTPFWFVLVRLLFSLNYFVLVLIISE